MTVALLYGLSLAVSNTLHWSLHHVARSTFSDVDCPTTHWKAGKNPLPGKVFLLRPEICWKSDGHKLRRALCFDSRDFRNKLMQILVEFLEDGEKTVNRPLTYNVQLLKTVLCQRIDLLVDVCMLLHRLKIWCPLPTTVSSGSFKAGVRRPAAVFFGPWDLPFALWAPWWATKVV